VLHLLTGFPADPCPLLSAARTRSFCLRHVMFDALSRQLGGQSAPAMPSGLLLGRLLLSDRLFIASFNISGLNIVAAKLEERLLIRVDAFASRPILALEQQSHAVLQMFFAQLMFADEANHRRLQLGGIIR